MLQLQRFTLDFTTFNRKKLNDEVSFPLYLNMNHFLDSEAVQSKEKLQQLVAENPLIEAQGLLKKSTKPIGKIPAKTETDFEIANETQKSFEISMANELGDLIDDGGSQEMSKGARLRLEKKIKEAEEHKKRMEALKTKKTKPAAKPRFDRSKLTTAFMNNAKKSKDETNGWALDFDNHTSQDPRLAQQQLISEEEQMKKALKNSMEDITNGHSAKTRAETEDQSTKSIENKEEAKLPEKQAE